MAKELTVGITYIIIEKGDHEKWLLIRQEGEHLFLKRNLTVKVVNKHTISTLAINASIEEIGQACIRQLQEAITKMQEDIVFLQENYVK